MAIKANRVDFRMVHGQVGSMWVMSLNITRIIVISDGAAQDTFIQKTMKLGAPPNVTIEVYSVEEAMEHWRKDQFGKGNILVIFQYINEAVRCYKDGYPLKALNVANVPQSAQTTHLTKTINLTKEDKAYLDELAASGVRLFSAGKPDERETDLTKPLKKWKG